MARSKQASRGDGIPRGVPVWLVCCAMACSAPESERTAPERVATTAQPIAFGTPDVNHLVPGVVRLTDATGCSGTLIAPDTVLSAAHCFDDNSCKPYCPSHQFLLKTGTLTVRFDNARDIPGFPPPQPLSFAITPSNVIVHPRWVAGDNDMPHFDLAIVHLPSAVSPLYAQPMRFATSNPLSIPQGLAAPTICVESASDPAHCNWLSQVFQIGGYANVPGGGVPRFGVANVNGGTGIEPLLVSFDEAFLSFIYEQGTSSPNVEEGDSGGPVFVLPGLHTDPLVWHPTDPIITERTIIGVNSTIRTITTPTSEVLHNRHARLSASANAAFMAPFADFDGDGVLDHLDLCPGIAASNDDGDGDGFGDTCDNCIADFNPDQRDADGDGIGNRCDACYVNDFTAPDGDGDGVPDACDDCPCDPTEVDPFADGDRDGVCRSDCGGAGDNCPDVANSNQANCNRDAELARSAEILGDACDPVPCPYFEPTFSFASTPIGGPAGKLALQETELDELAFTPRGSFDRDAVVVAPDQPVEVSVSVSNTRYRYCIHGPLAGVDCFSLGAVADSFLDLVDTRVDEDIDTLWHRVELAGSAVGANDGVRTYAATAPFTKVWLWQQDFDHWTATPWGSPWVPDITAAIAAQVPAFAAEGRFWSHGRTSVGTTIDISTGVHGLAVNPSVAASGLTNHYEPVTPYARKIVHKPIYQVKLIWIARDCPMCGPTLGIPVGGCPQCQIEIDPILPASVSRVVAVDELGTPGVLSPSSGLEPLREPLSPSLQAALADDVVWVDSAEPSAAFGWAGSAPAAVGVAPDGSSIRHAVFAASGKLLHERDLGRTRPQAFALSALAERSGFVAVYQRGAARVFVLGGTDASGAPVQEVDVLAVESDARTEIAPSAPLGDVLAATYSPADGRLWILDELALGKHKLKLRRIATLNPQTGAFSVLGTWPSIGLYDQHWLRIDRDESVLLFATSSKAKVHAAFRLKQAGSGVDATGVRFRPGRLSAPPVVDMHGYWLATQLGNQPVRVDRLGALATKPPPWLALGLCL